MQNLYSGLLIVAALFTLGCVGRATEAPTEDSNTTEEVVTTSASSRAYHVVPSESRIYWEGYRPAMGYAHNGTVAISRGNFFISEEGVITGGSFVIDMQTITVLDLEGNKKANLEAHLKGTSAGKEDDFFNITQYPTGTFEITKVEPLYEEADANILVSGDLTLKGITKRVQFKAYVVVDNGTCIVMTPLFNIDRTEWGIKILSNKFFENLKERFIDDQIGLRIELKADMGKNM